MIRRLFTCLCLLIAANHALAGSLITDAIEDDGTWTLGQAELAYLPAGSGLSPTAGAVMMHFNAGGDAAAYGTSSVSYSNTLAAGIYTVRIDVGSFSNRPLASIGAIGFTAGGQLLTPDTSSTPTPAQGEFKTWTFTYHIQSATAQQIGFRITVPQTGEHRNVAFDNLQIDFIPEPPSLISDAIEDDGTWTLGQAELAYLPAGSGLSPTAGAVMMHFNEGGDTASYGTSFVNYTNRAAVGTYIASIDVGSFTNRPIGTVGAIGMTLGGQLLIPATSSTPTPAQGEFKTWVFTYTNTLCNDQALGFRISVPQTGQQRNIAFDNLRIEFIPDTNAVCVSIFHAVEICWDSQSNKTYQLQWSAASLPAAWSNLGPPVPGTGSAICVTESTRGQPERLYRVQVLP